MASERAQLRITNELAQVLNAMIVPNDLRTAAAINDLIARIDTGNVTDFDAELADIFALIDETEATFTNYLATQLPAVFSTQTAAITGQLAGELGRQPISELDTKTIFSLTRSTIEDWQARTAESKVALDRFFKHATKQTVLDEQEITRLLADGLIDKADAREAKKLLKRAFEQAPEKVLDRAAIDRKKARLLSDFVKRVNANPNENLTESLRAALIEKKRKTLEAGRYIQLVDKNGIVRTYSADTYSELVARTKIGDAQNVATIEQGEVYGVKTFQVTRHNTTSPQCIPHEGRTYTTARDGQLAELFPALTLETTPTYHTNCQHRLLAIPLTQREINIILRRRVA